ncbi:MAG: sensor histidine kinase [bacterium]
MINIGRKNYTVGMIPLKSYNDVQLGAIIAAYSDTQSSDIQGRLIRSLIGVAIVGIIAAYSAGYFIAKSVTKPIQDLVEGVEIISKGNLDHQIGTNAQGEIKFLVDSVNQMTVSLKKENERRLSAERIAAWQDVARTMAHEIKNPLWPIQLSIRSLKRAYESKSDDFDKIFAECTDTIIEEVESLRRIVDEFSNFARMPKAQLKPENINDIIKDTLALYKNLPESIDIKVNLYDNIPKIMADKEQLSRAFINIINNAIQAMPDGGSLTIATSIDDTLGIVDVKNTVKIIFADTGVGIPSEIKDKVFQPYVTTKEGGTGLGMAIVQRIITEHNGKIEVESEENVGTKFTIFLPIIK